MQQQSNVYLLAIIPLTMFKVPVKRVSKRFGTRAISRGMIR
nr:hypothetical protein [Paenibacillus sp. 1001270B_150601_E10]